MEKQMKKYYEAYDDRYKKIHTEEKVSWADENPSKIILDLLLKYSANSNSKIFEIGCGEGQNAIYLMENGLHITATDVSPEAINWCKSKAKENGVDSKNFFVLDALENNLIETFNSVRDAIKIWGQGVNKILNGSQKQTKGFVFKFIN